MLFLNNTTSPTPAPTNNPDNIVETFIIFSKYNLVNITDEAQFGINPINPAIIGPNIGLLVTNVAIASSPIIVINIFTTNVIINIKIVIVPVCFNADLTILFSQ